MRKLRPLLKKWATPITIMLIPHSRSNSLRVKMPFLVLASLLVFAGIGFVYTAALSYRVVDYYQTKRKLAYLSSQFQEMRTTMTALKESESQFKRLFSFDSKKQVFDAMENSNEGSIDIEVLKKEINASMASVAEVREYLSKQKDIYQVTPRGWPVDGRISSGFGMRLHPKYHTEKFHTGIDLSVPTGTPVHATADGIVSFSSWSPGNGNIVVVEHGQGFSTVYAHNSKNLVKVAQTVHRGDIVADAGSTGVTTGSHVHYEVWKNGRYVDPTEFGRKTD
ncbi:MAG: M23 family metallopeptidase [Desulfobacteraceae bacterium]|nr:M23 family metallopeptidase [Desulfobacteraceae bacterium]